MFAFTVLILIVSALLISDSTAKETSYVNAKDPTSECGLKHGGPIIQQIMVPRQSVESLFWQTKDQRLFSISPVGRNANFYHYVNGETISQHIAELDNYTMTTFIPVRDGNKQWVIATKRALFGIHVHPLEETPYDIREIETAADSEHFFVRGRAAIDGKFWLGLLRKNYTPGDVGALIKINLENGKVETVEEKYPSYTGLTWNMDNTKLYVIDSISNVIRCYKYDEFTGGISNMKVVFNMTTDSANKITGTISSITMNHYNRIWFGVKDGGGVVEYDPDRRVIIRVIGVPATSVESLAFGGNKFAVLFVATYNKLSEPLGASVYAISGTGCKGFQGNELLISKKLFDE